MGITDSYSGIVMNQNASSSPIDWRGTLASNWIYQIFYLPSNYERGSNDNELRIPDLSGFQILVSVDQGYAPAASLDYTVQYYDSGWNTLTSGTIIGTPIDGSHVWFDVIFPNSIAITPALLTKQFRFGVQTRSLTSGALGQPVQRSANGSYVVNGVGYPVSLVDGQPVAINVANQPAFLLSNSGEITYSMQQGVGSIYASSPYPALQGLPPMPAYRSDGTTPLQGIGTTSTLNFRLLGLVADSGTDFLGNEYRSCVISNAIENVDSTTVGANNNYWMSPPLPSRFAVQSLYFDVRPEATTPVATAYNMIGNPSFEWDVAGQLPRWWGPISTGGPTITTRTVGTGWSSHGVQSLALSGVLGTGQSFGFQSPSLSVSGASQSTISYSVDVDIVRADATTSFVAQIVYQDVLNNTISSSYLPTSTLGVQTLSGIGTVPPNTVSVIFRFQVAGGSTPGTMVVNVDSIQATLTPTPIPYFDGDIPGYQWAGERGLSTSMQLSADEIDDNFVVVDGVVVDPLTPNMAFNVYYSQDDAYTSDSMTEADWEQKLWTRVPESYVALQRQNYMFPEPVHAKYMKVEFTNLQSQSYNVGNFAQPVSYKKFPTWVATFFIGQMDQPSFIATHVGVEYDALRFAYSYYLDDLGTSPNKPVAPPESAAAQLTSYFSAPPQDLDATTLDQINLMMKPYEQPAGTVVDTGTLLGKHVLSLVQSSTSATTMAEGNVLDAPDYSTVSSDSRQAILFEQSLPVMFFFLTCRHTYKEVSAPFDANRAYFAGVKDIAFLRENYTIAADTDLYIESGGDGTNTEFSDFILDNQVQYTY